ncbi:MAG: hypothetical protein AAGF11_20885 [Myxococcota bacterium]
MSSSFTITHIEPTPTFTLYHLDTPKRGATAIVFFRHGPTDLEPSLAMLAQARQRFDFEVEPVPVSDDADPRLRTACRIRALTLSSRGLRPRATARVRTHQQDPPCIAAE